MHNFRAISTFVFFCLLTSFSFSQNRKFSIGISKYSHADSVKIRFTAKEYSTVSFYQFNEHLRDIELEPNKPRIFTFQRDINIEFVACEEGNHLSIYFVKKDEIIHCEGQRMAL